MKIIDTYNAFAKELFIEAEVDDDKIIKYKKEDGEQGEMKASSAKTMPQDHPAKVAYDKMSDSDSDDKSKGQALGGSDFDRDGDGKPDMDSDGGDDKSDMSSGSNDDIKADLRKNPEKLDDMSDEELEDVFPTHEEYQEFEDLRNQKVLKDKHPKLHKLVSQQVQAEKELEQAEAGGDEQEIQDAEQKRENASNDVYYHIQDNSDELDSDKIPTYSKDLKDLVRGEEKKKDESFKVINGVKYRPIKESKKEKKNFVEKVKENSKRFAKRK